MGKNSILIVDDDLILLKTAEEILAQKQFNDLIAVEYNNRYKTLTLKSK